MQIKVENKMIGGTNPCFIAVDVGSNHDKSIDKAKELIDEAAKNGADAVKFQTNPVKELYSKNSPKFEKDPMKPYDLIKQVMWPDELQGGVIEKELADYCRKKGVVFFTTPVGKESTDWIADIAPMIKIASFEADALKFLKYLATKKNPMILSTGARYMDEVEDAVEAITSQGNNDLVILHCTSNYPCDPEEANLKAIQTLKNKFKYVIGYSDHNDAYDSIVPRLGEEYEQAGIISGALAVSFGAKFLEKHFTLTRKFKGPDSPFALEPEDLQNYVDSVRSIEKRLKTDTTQDIIDSFKRDFSFVEEMIGDGQKKPVPRELADPRQKGQRFLYFANDVKKGNLLKPEDVTELRGMTSKDTIKSKYAFKLDTVFKNELVKDGEKDTCITWSHFGKTPPEEKHKFV